MDGTQKNETRSQNILCDRKKAMECFIFKQKKKSLSDKKKYLKLLPKNEFRKPTKMPQSE